MGAAERDSAGELLAVAPLMSGATVIGPCTLVASGDQVVGFTSAEILRKHAGADLAVGSIPIKQWTMGRYTGIGLVELASALPADGPIKPLAMNAICATIDTRGAPSVLIVFDASGKRVLVNVHVDRVESGGETIARLATPIAPLPDGVAIDGAPLFAWFPAERALGRSAATLACAVAYPYRTQVFKPRDVPAIAELVGLEDLGRAMSWASGERADPKQVAGELEDHEMPNPPTDT